MAQNRFVLEKSAVPNTTIRILVRENSALDSTPKGAIPNDWNRGKSLSLFDYFCVKFLNFGYEGGKKIYQVEFFFVSGRGGLQTLQREPFSGTSLFDYLCVKFLNLGYEGDKKIYQIGFFFVSGRGGLHSVLCERKGQSSDLTK